MIDKQIVIAIAEQQIDPQKLFVVDVLVSAANDIEVIVDSDERVSIDDCAALSRKIEAQMDREIEDFSLTVASAGIGYPFKVERQFQKCIGCEVEVKFTDGNRVIAMLQAADGESITINYEALEAVEGKKKKQKVDKIEKINKTEIKSVCEALTIK